MLARLLLDSFNYAQVVQGGGGRADVVLLLSAKVISEGVQVSLCSWAMFR